MKLSQDTIKIIVTALVSLILILLLAISVSLFFGGQTTRQLKIDYINGDVSLSRSYKNYPLSKKTNISSGDVIKTAEDSIVRLDFDDGNFITLEENTTAYIYFTNISEMGEVSINVVEGAVLSKLGGISTSENRFSVKTPNTEVSLNNAIFRTSFSQKSHYQGLDDVYVTNVQTYKDYVDLQLYDFADNKVDEQMRLVEGNAAELISSESTTKYAYLNYKFDITDISESALMELLRASADVTLAYKISELDVALREVKSKSSQKTEESSATSENEDEDLILVTEQTTVPIRETESETKTKTASQNPEYIETLQSETEVPQTESETTTIETKEETEAPTTLSEVEYTTYAGPKWWFVKNPNPNLNDDDFDDGGVFD